MLFEFFVRSLLKIDIDGHSGFYVCTAHIYVELAWIVSDFDSLLYVILFFEFVNISLVNIGLGNIVQLLLGSYKIVFVALAS